MELCVVVAAAQFQTELQCASFLAGKGEKRTASDVGFVESNTSRVSGINIDCCLGGSKR